MSKEKVFYPLTLAIMTVSDSRNKETDSSGDLLSEWAISAGHQVHERSVVPNNRYLIRAQLSQWIASETIQVVLINGGTGFAANNCTIEAINPLFDKEVPGFGEQFRALSFEDIGTSAMQSGASAGLANKTLIFAMPGSGGACKLAWQHLIESQIDSRVGPCNFVAHIKNSPQTACQ